ncbi:MAG: heterodisulfide reductase-related iron-sulfur binding cluster [Rhodospirillaceae bacterium]
MARRALTQAKPVPARRDEGKDAFQKMSRAVRVLSRLQLPQVLLARLNPSSHPERAEAPDIVFYTVCNMLRTPHIGLLCLDVFDRLGLSYAAIGGPSHCCGILQLRPGDTENAGRQIVRTMERFAETGAKEVVAWCPTCQLQIAETTPPADGQAHPFGTLILPVFLAARLDRLKPMMTTPVNERIALHEYPG